MFFESTPPHKHAIAATPEGHRGLAPRRRRASEGSHINFLQQFCLCLICGPRGGDDEASEHEQSSHASKLITKRVSLSDLRLTQVLAGKPVLAVEQLSSRTGGPGGAGGAT